MELRTFIQQTLVEISEAVADAARETNNNGVVRVAPRFRQIHANTGDLVGYGEDREPIFVVHFDVAVVADERASGKAGVRVMGIGGDGELEKRNSTESRIRFQVPVSYG